MPDYLTLRKIYFLLTGPHRARTQRRQDMIAHSQKVAIVTGASGGIGAAVAKRLARDGFTVVVNYAGNAASADAVVARIEAAGGRAIAAQADIADVHAVRRMFESAETAFGGVDVLINNAGIMTLATIAESDDALFDRLITVNLKGTFNTLREAARRLRDGGRIVNFSSSVASACCSRPMPSTPGPRPRWRR
jgi:3-oxoacyl-[acyl-carrier protein] reductase